MNFIHPKAEVDSQVQLGDNVYIAAFACLRADEGSITVGDNVSIQETCVVHGIDVSIGNNVTVGHGAIVHGCKVADNVLVGIRATLLNRCEIGEGSIIAAGTVVLEGMKIPANSVVVGVPAKVIRETTEKDKKRIRESWESYVNKIKKMEKE